MVLKRLTRVGCAGVLSLASSCGSGPAPSPLALYPGSPMGDAARLRGTLEMDGDCLYIISEGGARWLAAFPAPGTTWDPEERSLRVADRVLRVGDAGDFGGGEAKGPEGIPWVQAPKAECDSSQIWLVTTLVEP